MSTDATTPLRVALLGLPPDDRRIPPDVGPLIAKLLASVKTQIEDAGMQYDFYRLSPDESLAALASKLQSQRPDVVVIGNGIRRDMELTPFMEQVIDNVRTNAPQAKLAFNTMPDNTLDAVKRWFPTGAK